jgi:hypothetical protein
MSTITAVRTVPRLVVGTYLKAARVPLNVAGKVTRQSGNEKWAPALAFDAFEANVDTFLGGILKDDQLQERGRLLQAKVAELRRAEELRAVAEQERAEADAKLKQKQEAAERQRLEAERRAQQREQEVQQQAQAKQREVEQKTAKKAAAVRNVQAAQEKAIAREERKAKQEALAQESEALFKAKEAVEARETAALVEDAIEGSKVARKTP